MVFWCEDFLILLWKTIYIKKWVQTSLVHPNKITCYCCQEQITKINNLSIHIRNTIIIFEIYVLQLIFRERDISTILYTSYQMHSVFLQTTREIFASKHHHLSLHITIFFILDVANIFLITVIYEDINIDIISYTIVYSCNCYCCGEQFTISSEFSLHIHNCYMQR